jgi:predicted enzyme related to lactoylglutathione lyase
MADSIYKPVWVDLASPDAAASRAFYANLFGWEIAVDPDPQYGGYAQAKVGDKAVAGIGPKMSPDAPTAWSVYIGTGDIAAMMAVVESAGGTVVAPPMQVGAMGSMAVLRDPAGAFVSAWQPNAMGGFAAGGPGTFGWAELNARGADKAVDFYTRAFGWQTRITPMGDGQPDYIEFMIDGQAVAGAMEMNPMVPAEMPSYWMVYFAVDDVDASFERALAGGAHEMLPPLNFPGGRFAIVGDPQGAVFGLLKTTPR